MQGEMFFPEIEVQSNEKVEAQATHITKWLLIEFDLMEKEEFKYVFAKSCEIKEQQEKINGKKKKYGNKVLKDFPEPVSLLVKQKIKRTIGLSL
ncbi:hypothetical protein [Priestia megaterium]|uniref:Uncharacterized protein n=1 Tax=Priestia megaterium TaxID=1404 RepID=A0A6M6E645_PRIMG|nr:hypothetical protein [Priestia megaterium]QJX81006.1 hypothetical protein FDZ14_33490 [Priestia megaterium]